MSVTLNIYYHGNNGSAFKFAKEMISLGIVDNIRKESGNLRYDYFLPFDDNDTVLLIDSWQDQNALDNHHKSSLMAQISALREKYDLHMKVERYVLDKTGIPDSDEAFIRK